MMYPEHGDMKIPPQPDKAPAESTDTRSAETRSPDTRPGDTGSTDTRFTDSRPTETGSTETRPGDTRSTETGSRETRVEPESADVPAAPPERSPEAQDETPREPDQKRPGDLVREQEQLVLLDMDSAEVEQRWREVQARFVDDPGQAVEQADALVEEVIHALASSLTARTDAMRTRSKNGHDTEQLRLTLRDYHGVLDRLLTLSGPQPH